MISGETSTGFKYEFDKRALSDWKTVKALTKMQKNEDALETIEAIDELGRILLTEKGFNKLLKHVEKCNDGYCCVDKVSEEIADIFKKAEELKN